MEEKALSNTPHQDDEEDGGVAARDTDAVGTKDDFAVGNDFVIAFEDITVRVPRSGWKCCTCIDSPLKNFGQEYLGMSVEERSAFYTLDRVSGFVRAGETVLVLGKSGSGKSTLLRALCGHLNETDELYGTLSLNGIPVSSKSNQRWRRMSNYVSASDASHSPVLTVAETFRFAAQCTSNGCTSEDEIEYIVQEMLEALGLDHVQDTVVGDENLRGVSGGQKRRVTVGEMMMDRNARFFCLDNITDGLASTDSFMLLEKISLVCKKYKTSAIISLLQPSDEIVSLFDKLLVLSSSGQMTYFGPATDRKMLCDIFLGNVQSDEDSGAISDLVMNQSMSNQSVMNQNSVEEEVVKRFLKSSICSDLIKDLAFIRASAPPIRDREHELVSMLPGEKYATSHFYQIQIISLRRLKLIARNAMTYSRVMIAILFGVIVGSLFSALKNDVIGALGRTGYIFLCSFLVLMLSAAVTIPEGFRQRPTLFKHRASEFYSGRIAYFVQVFLDIPLSATEATLIAAISYFWVKMNPGANHFFFFLGTLIALECVGQAFARLLCAVMRTQVSASTGSSLCILLFATVGGFMPTYVEITWVLRWLSWLTPVSYAFEAMMINEFDGRTLSGIITDGEAIGTVEGVNWLAVQGLPRASWGTLTQIKLFDLGMLFLWAMIFDAIGMYYQEHTRAWFHNQIRRPQAKVRRRSSDSKSASEIGKAMGLASQLGRDGDVENVPPGPRAPQSLSVKHLRYTVALGRKRRFTIESVLGPCLMKCFGKKLEKEERDQKELVLLNDISARFRRRRMTALMGQSGAGKTTLLDVIAGYKTGGKITGDIMIDGLPKVDSTWKKINGYAEQNDILNPYMSVLETLEFTATCRLPNHVDRKSVVSNVIVLMGLEDYTDMVVGREKEGEGLPKHARKRLTIANQLVVLPKVLFLDEPTSGLGVNAAALVIGAVRRSTDALGLITLATIHQPSRKMFEAFDDLILLVKGGRVAYMGELGPKSELVLSHFASLSAEDPPTSCNPADYILAAVNRVPADAAVQAYQDSSHYQSLASDMQRDMDAAATPDSISAHLPAGVVNTRWTEFLLLTKRHFLCEWRNPSYSLMRMTVSVGASLLLGVLFFEIPRDIQGAVFAIAAIFFLVFVLVIPMQAAVIPLIEDRAVLYREAVSGTYSRISYGLGQLVADIPFHIINTALMFISIYFLVGFRGGAQYMGYFLLMLFLANWVVMSMGQLYALVTPNEETANGLAGLSVILSVLLMGFLITKSAMPGGWVWAYWANLFRYILQGLVTNEVAGQTYQIDLSKLLPDLDTSQLGRNDDEDGNAGGFIEEMIIDFIIDLIKKGIDLPGEAILYYFGWANFDEENVEFTAPFKWNYCMIAVAVFLVGIETMKLLAIQLIVWTKR